jgi:hypothetical protein
MNGRVRQHAQASPIVLVMHGNQQGPALDELLAATGRPVIRVRTDAGAGRFVADPGEAYEFSGYQEGLGLALQALPAADDVPASITFVNDTLASGHPNCVARAVLAALAPPPTAGPAARVAGLRMPLNPAIASVSGPRGYLSTWAFTLTAARPVLQRVRFYGAADVRSSFGPTWTELPAPYREWVDRWLAPEHWLRGWYQACPGRPLDEATRQRKRLSIYLEHTLLPRLGELGFEPADVGQAQGGFAQWNLRLLRLIDRLHVNRLKLAHRLPQLLRPQA